MLHPVRFANGEALEARGILQKATIIYWVASSIKPIDKPMPGEHLSGREIEEFIDACWAIIDEKTVVNHRWIIAMTKERLVVSNCVPNTDADGIWMIDRETERYFLLTQGCFSFSSQLYEGTIFSGFLLRESVFQPSRLTNQERKAESGVLQKIRHFMGTGNRRKIVYESLETAEYRFHVRGIYRWCGERCCPSTWSAQQLNICLNTPSSEEYWFHRHPDNAFSLVNELWDEMLPRAGRSEAERFGTSTRNPQLRYPHHNQIVTTLDGERHVAGHFQPRYLGFDPTKQDRVKVAGILAMRLARTQYPFVYSLLPDNHRKAKQISATLKSGGGKPLMATVLTQEGERFIRSVFLQNKRHHYKVWYCAKLVLDGETCWTPIAPVKSGNSQSTSKKQGRRKRGKRKK